MQIKHMNQLSLLNRAFNILILDSRAIQLWNMVSYIKASTQD